MKHLLVCLAIVLALPAAAEVPSWDDPAWYAAPANPLNLTMSPDTGRGAAGTIGPNGGTFQATGANGDVYKLTIPEGALFTDTRITIWPVATAEGMPEGSGPFSGVILEPEGLELAKTGWLEITPATPIPPENRALWGFYGKGEDARGEINWPGAGDRIVIPLDHFSGAGVSFADRANLRLDRWRQKALEDRITSQVSAMINRMDATKTWDDDEFSEAINSGSRILLNGWRVLATSPASNCDDVKGVVTSVLRLVRIGQLIGIQIETPGLDMNALFERYWSQCFPQQVQICLDTGDLPGLVAFALSFERQRQLLAMEGSDGSLFGDRTTAVRAALERCGRFKLEIQASGRWQDPAGVAGNLSFKVEVPIRLTFLQPEGFNYLIEGEAPASNVSVSFNDAECWDYHGFINGKAMLARLTTYEFRKDDKHGPLKLEIRSTAPEILADISCDGYQMQAPMSPMVWAVAHKADRTGEEFMLARFQAKGHPTLFEMEWTGDGFDDGLNASDTTKLKLIHIAQ